MTIEAPPEPFREPIGASDRPKIIATAIDTASVWRKRARVCAVQLEQPVIVGTEHGTMTAEIGDWLVTNHPDDDATSDVWPVSAARFARTYEQVPGPAEFGEPREQTVVEIVVDQITAAISNLLRHDGERGADRYQSLAITKLEEAVLWLLAPTIRQP